MRKQLLFALRYAIKYLEQTSDNQALLENERLVLESCIRNLKSIAGPDKLPF